MSEYDSLDDGDVFDEHNKLHPAACFCTQCRREWEDALGEVKMAEMRESVQRNLAAARAIGWDI